MNTNNPNTIIPTDYLGQWGRTYQNDLLTNILPFWLKHGLDNDNGGYFTCLDRNGNLMDTNKSVWFQGRFAFVLAYAYNHVEKNEAWLAACKSGIDFIEKYCFDTDGRMFYEVTATGIPVRKRRYVFSETFAAIAMAQYSIASGDKSYAGKALALFKQV
ncbi:MAG: AGE family epimerase/isomerase, partial [Tannerellaceae bacterium]